VQLNLPPAVGFGDFPSHFSPTFGAFDLLIPAAANENLKEFELLVGDSSLTCWATSDTRTTIVSIRLVSGRPAWQSGPHDGG
jgi:hypothetical protein